MRPSCTTLQNVGGMEMSKRQSNVFSEERRQEISRLVKTEGKVTVYELCQRFSVSPATVRTDLTELEKLGLLKRTHGGAISARSAGYELTSREKVTRNAAAKAAIAREAVKFIHPGDAIAIDTGTTGMELAKLVGSIENLTVVTNDVAIALYLEQNTDVSVLLLGGVIRKNFHCTSGEFVTDALERIHINTLFLATNGINLSRGLSTPNVEMARVKKKLIEVSERVILIADKDKFENDSFAYFSGIEKMDIIISNAELDEELMELLTAEEIEYVHVPISGEG